VRAVYAPADRDEAAVTVEIQASTESWRLICCVPWTSSARIVV